MSETFAPQEQTLAEQLVGCARGPKRNGLFAVWLLIRACGDRYPPDLVSEIAHRRRLQSLERRLSSLSLPPPLRRALLGSIRELRGGAGNAEAVALQQLVAPVRETVGPAAAQALADAAAAARDFPPRDDH